MESLEHIPVFLHEVLTALRIKPDSIYFDATVGRGGHAKEILARLDNNGILFAIDRDETAVEEGKRLFSAEHRFIIEKGEFSMIEKMVAEHGWIGKVDGILLDLGVSSPQIDDPQRGFSFISDGPLDMRMDPTQGESAQQWLARANENELAEIFKEYGEERYARRVARAIIHAREKQELKSTLQLAEIIKKAIPKWDRHKDPATRCFQAIRIFINNELGQLQMCLQQCLNILKPGGRLCVISFHSLEDRIVKRFMRLQQMGERLPIEVPIRNEELHATMKIIGKIILPSEQEIKINPRARSAKLRIAEKCK